MLSKPYFIGVSPSDLPRTYCFDSKLITSSPQQVILTNALCIQINFHHWTVTYFLYFTKLKQLNQAIWSSTKVICCGFGPPAPFQEKPYKGQFQSQQKFVTIALSCLKEYLYKRKFQLRRITHRICFPEEERKIHLILHLMEVVPLKGKGYFQHACCAFLASSQLEMWCLIKADKAFPCTANHCTVPLVGWRGALYSNQCHTAASNINLSFLSKVSGTGLEKQASKLNFPPQLIKTKESI